MITVFTHPECEYSKMLINELDDIGEKFQNINLLVDPEFDALWRKNTEGT